MDDVKALKKPSSRTKKRAIFFAIMVTPFILHSIIFYFYVNIDTFRLAFIKYELVAVGKPYQVSFAGFENFKWAFIWLVASPHYYLNAIKLHLWNLCIGVTLSLFFSFYIYKKLPWASTFKFFLFLPHILSTLLLIILFKFICEDVYIAIANQWFGVEQPIGLFNINRPAELRLALIIFFNIYTTQGTAILVYSSTMEAIDPSLVESAQLDGTNIVQEFFLLTMPNIWSTFVTLIITTLTGIFTNNMNLYSFFGQSAPDEVANIGYRLYLYTLNSTLATENSTSKLNYSAMSAISIIVTAILTPLTLVIRKYLLKLGPSVN